jgi:hypothetical protein
MVAVHTALLVAGIFAALYWLGDAKWVEHAYAWGMVVFIIAVFAAALVAFTAMLPTVSAWCMP